MNCTRPQTMKTGLLRARLASCVASGLVYVYEYRYVYGGDSCSAWRFSKEERGVYCKPTTTDRKFGDVSVPSPGPCPCPSPTSFAWRVEEGLGRGQRLGLGGFHNNTSS